MIRGQNRRQSQHGEATSAQAGTDDRCQKADDRRQSQHGEAASAQAGTDDRRQRTDK
ncbi:MAG: hypothetical protein KA059_06160 [Elusimicrobiales bacterium]|nr:hypothetical protein [Elusimicrobiales bacterium]